MSSWKPLRGIITPVATPLTKSGNAIDPVGTRRLLEHIIEGGVSGVFLLGSTGESPSLSPSLRREFISMCCEIIRAIDAKRQSSGGDSEKSSDGGSAGTASGAVGDCIRILVGVTDPCPAETIALARHAAACGAHAAVVASPFYFPLTQRELANYMGHIAEELDPLPIILYNMPALTKVTFEIETIRVLAMRYGRRTVGTRGGGGRIVGIKDSSFDLTYMEKLCRVKQELCPTWTVLTGAEHHVGFVVRMGGNGGVVGGSNLFPETFVSFFEAAEENSFVKEERARKKVETLKAIYTDGRFVQATKCALSVLGICDDTFALPLLPLTNEARKKVEDVILAVKKM